MTKSRIGVLGGSFDPIHCGHLDAAEAARSALDLDEVLLMPSRTPPHRQAPRASAFHRFAMTVLACRARPGLVASDLELAAPGPSYTSATLDRLTGAGRRAVQLFFIAGADAVAEIATWHDYPAILHRAHFVAISRPGAPVSTLRERLPGLAACMRGVTSDGSPPDLGSVEFPSILLVDATTRDVSSTNVRQAIAAGRPLAGLVPGDVEAHIRRYRLYSPTDEAAGGLQ